MNIIDSNLSFNSGHEVRSGSPAGIVLHHAASNGSVEAIHSYHKNRGWIGIGYHFYVRKDGKVYRGRPENWIGAHAVGHNNKIGICAEGNFMNDVMGSAQKDSIIELIAYLLKKYGDLNICRHKDVDATACPGTNYPYSEIVTKAKNGTGAPAPDASLQVGDIVTFTGSRHYISAETGTGRACKPGKAKITAISEGAAHPYHLVKVDGSSSTVYGWVDADCVEELQQTTAPEPPADPCELVLPTLKKGSEGEPVKALQNLLIGCGYSCGALGADMDFGADTETALRDFQREHDLKDDGICGSMTWAKLLGV